MDMYHTPRHPKATSAMSALSESTFYVGRCRALSGSVGLCQQLSDQGSSCVSRRSANLLARHVPKLT
eukprot:2206354-Prymnesium_polylepis.1